MVRSDLPPGLQLAQVAHAAIGIALEAPEVVAGWHEASNNIVVVSAASETQLLELVDRCAPSAHPFREPDLDDQVTAVAFRPGVTFTELPLAGAALA